MFIKLGNLNIHYKVAGQGDSLLLLHGWGCSIEHYIRLRKHLAKRFTVYSIDLPGFGLSNSPETIWGVVDYANLVAEFIKAIQVYNPILVGHSLGGKIIISIMAHHLIEIKKIILISSAGVKLPRALSVVLKIWFFKSMKFLAQLPIIRNIFGVQFELYKRKFGSQDYRNASSQLRSILVKIINEDVTAFLSQIKVPTLLLWGDEDRSTPLQAGRIMQEKILGSKLVVFPGSGHFPFLDSYEKVIAQIDNFLE